MTRGARCRRATTSLTRTRGRSSSSSTTPTTNSSPTVTTKFTLEVGDDFWPLPIPIVKVGEQMDVRHRRRDRRIVYRRIGRNELGAIEACRGIVEAQTEYASEGRDGLPAGIYAQKLVSDKGKHNGLYWPAQPGERASPVGPFIASAVAEGYGKVKGTAGEPQPYHGYIYRLLTSQGAAAPGGAKSYLKDGRLSGGYAVLAYPVEYEESGVESFMISNDGVLYQKDLGATDRRSRRENRRVQSGRDLDQGRLTRPRRPRRRRRSRAWIAVGPSRPIHGRAFRPRTVDAAGRASVRWRWSCCG